MLKRLICFILNHKLIVTNQVCEDIQELKCIRCGNEYGIHHGIQVVLPLDDELKETHKWIRNTYNRLNNLR